jgi:argininosuccinate lyase
MQEDKEPVFDAVEQLLLVLPAMAGLVATLQVDADVLRASTPTGHALATDVAEWLVRGGVAFRDAHEISGAFVRWCDERGLELWEVPDEDLPRIDARLTPEVRSVLSVDGAIASRSAVGGTAPSRVAEQLAALRAQVDQHSAWATRP